MFSGADYNRPDDVDVAYPGVALYHQGMDLVAVVSTGVDVWKLQVNGCFYFTINE